MNFSQKMINLFKTKSGWIMFLVYLIVALWVNQNPDEMILYFVPEALGMMVVGMLYELITSTSISSFFKRFLLYLFFIGLTLFLIMFPFTWILFFNEPQLPELNLFYSETADKIYQYLDTKDSLIDLFTMPLDLFNIDTLIIFGLSMLHYLVLKIKMGSMFGSGVSARVPYELAYVSFMTLGFLIGALPAFIVGYFIPNGFTYVLIIIMKLYTNNTVYPQSFEKSKDLKIRKKKSRRN
ncbi:MAG: hypothetical protein ACWA41_06360 [Putridiphycobacter sp.]